MRKGEREKGRKGEDNPSSIISASPRLQRVSASQIDWSKVNRVLVVRLRSIGDTVLATPSLIALRRFLPDAQIDILLEDWVAPVLEEFDAVDNIITVPTGNTPKVPEGKLSSKELFFVRSTIAWSLREIKYDVAFNLHGGTTSTFFVRASGAKHRVGFANYRYSFLYNHLLSSPLDFWKQEFTHSAEQQLALLGFVGVPVEDKPKSLLKVTKTAETSIREKLAKSQIPNPKSQIALLHPVAAFDTKQWATENFARVAEFLYEKNFQPIAIATKKEREVLENLKQSSSVPILTFDNLTLPEITALASRAKIFIGNDSGIAHIAAAVQTPTVVIFGSSNINHWRPWTDAPNEIVYEKLPCQPCAGYFCKEFDEPQCIKRVSVKSVIKAIEKIIGK